jgi:hypothetical protein
MPLNESFIKVSRNIIKHWLFDDPDQLIIWIYLICVAQYTDSQQPIKIGRKERYLKRGEFCTSMEQISHSCKVSERKVRTVLDTLKENNMIAKTVGRGKNIPYVAKVVNYDKWQGLYKHVSIKGQSNDNQATTYYKEYKENNLYKDISETPTYMIKCCDKVLSKNCPRDLSMTCPTCDSFVKAEQVDVLP